jgi:hypothetical protein
VVSVQQAKKKNVLGVVKKLGHGLRGIQALAGLFRPDRIVAHSQIMHQTVSKHLHPVVGQGMAK